MNSGIFHKSDCSKVAKTIPITIKINIIIIIIKTGFPDILKKLELEIKQKIEEFLTAPLLQLK